MTALVPFLPISGTTRSLQNSRVLVLRSSENSDVTNDEIEPNGEETPSAAKEWQEKQGKASQHQAKKKFAVVGGGWGGWGAAKALCEADDVEVILIDALPDPTGKTPYLSKTGKPGTSHGALSAEVHNTDTSNWCLVLL